MATYLVSGQAGQRCPAAGQMRSGSGISLGFGSLARSLQCGLATTQGETSMVRAPHWLMLLLLLACGPHSVFLDDPPAPVALTPKETLNLLARATGSSWRVRYDPMLGTAAFLEGRSAPLATIDHL